MREDRGGSKREMGRPGEIGIRRLCKGGRVDHRKSTLARGARLRGSQCRGG